MSRSRIIRGRATQRMAAQWFATHGWPFATSKGASEGGRDIENMPGLAPEVKATRDGKLTSALWQAARNAGGDLPFVVWRPDRYGQGQIADWVVALRLEDATRLLRAAGYGDPLPDEEIR